MANLFVPHELKTIEVDTEKKIFRINGEDFGKGCTGFRITCHEYNGFDIRVEVDTTVHFASYRCSKCTGNMSWKTNDLHFSARDDL